MTATVPFYRRRSALQAFACPFYFKGRYIEGIADETLPARRGRAFHEIVRRYVTLLVAHRCSDDLDLAQQAFQEGIAVSMVPDATIAELDELWWRFVPTFQLDVDAVLLVEEKPDDEYDWTPDLVRVAGDTLDITDFKSHWAVLSQTAADSAFQAKFYSARARKLWPNFRHYRFQFWFVRWGVIVAVEFDQAAIDRHEEHLELLERGIETAIATNDFPPVPGEVCGYCRLTCPVADDARVHPVRVTAPDEALRALGEYLVLQAAADARRRALEQWTDWEGPVALVHPLTGDGVEFGPRRSGRMEFPLADVLAVFQAYQLPTPQVSLSKTALKPYLTQVRYRHLAPALERLGKAIPGTEYRVRKVGDVAPLQSEEGGSSL